MAELNKRIISSPVESDISFYLHEKGGRLGIPVSANFELTQRCNFNCKMCYIHTSDCSSAQHELSAEQWLEIGRQAAQSGTVFTLLTGGEPLVRDDFAQIYTGLKKLGLMVSVNTNGSLLGGEILELFKKEPPTRLNISLYGASDITYERLCKNSGFSVVKKNIVDAVNAGLQVKLNYSITPDNCCDMEEIFNFAREMKLHVQSSPYMYPPIRSGQAVYGENSGRFTPEQAAFYRIKSELLYLGKERFLMKAQQMRDFSCDDNSTVAGKRSRQMHCRAGKSNCWIDWRGNMGICGMIPAEDNSVVEKGFSACWENAKETAKQILLPEKCVGCEYSSVCSVCAAVCMCESGKTDAVPEYMCTYSRKIYEDMMRIKEENSEEGK